MYEAAPLSARDLDLEQTVHWAVDPTVDDAFIAGVYWAGGWAFERLFGEILGPSWFELATNQQEYRDGVWSPVTGA